MPLQKNKRSQAAFQVTLKGVSWKKSVCVENTVIFCIFRKLRYFFVFIEEKKITFLMLEAMFQNEEFSRKLKNKEVILLLFLRENLAILDF